jgi:hypothetical protein
VKIVAAFVAGALFAGGGTWAAVSSQTPATHLDILKVQTQVRYLERQVYHLCVGLQPSPPTFLCDPP